MTTITLPLAVVEQALEALRHVVRQAQENLVPTIHYGPVNDVINRLEAALAQQAEPTPTFHVEPLKWGCRVCRIGADGKAYGYVCPRSDCPTKVTCGGAV